jgi:hypothetical protein
MLQQGTSQAAALSDALFTHTYCFNVGFDLQLHQLYYATASLQETLLLDQSPCTVLSEVLWAVKLISPIVPPIPFPV